MLSDPRPGALKQKYSDWMYTWENRLCFRSTDRVVRPFDWGLDWASSWRGAAPLNGHGPADYLSQLNRTAIESSDDYFGYQTPDDFRLHDNHLEFTSALPTPYPENN